MDAIEDERTYTDYNVTLTNYCVSLRCKFANLDGRFARTDKVRLNEMLDRTTRGFYSEYMMLSRCKIRAYRLMMFGPDVQCWNLYDFKRTNDIVDLHQNTYRIVEWYRNNVMFYNINVLLNFRDALFIQNLNKKKL